MDSRRSAAFRLLGIPFGSDRETVARAYHRLARSTHPDVSADPEAGQRFAALTAAYRLASELPGLYAETAPPEPEQQRPAPAPPETAVDPAASGRVSFLDPDVAIRAWPRPPIVAGPVRVRPSTRGGGGEVGDG